LIDYGDMAVGATSTVQEANNTNIGNRRINISVYGYGHTPNDGLAMNCTIGNISVENEKFSLVSGADFDTFGYVIQGGWYVSEDWELIARWDQFLNDSDAGPGDDFSTLSFGANYYIHGHAAKFTIDAQLYLDDIAGTGGQITANEGIGYLGNGAEEDEFVIRAQFQLLF